MRFGLNKLHSLLNFQGIEFAEAFLLEYQREDGGEWIRFRNKFGEEVSQQAIFKKVIQPIKPTLKD